MMARHDLEHGAWTRAGCVTRSRSRHVCAGFAVDGPEEGASLNMHSEETPSQAGAARRRACHGPPLHMCAGLDAAGASVRTVRMPPVNNTVGGRAYLVRLCELRPLVVWVQV